MIFMINKEIVFIKGNWWYLILFSVHVYYQLTLNNLIWWKGKYTSDTDGKWVTVIEY